MSSRHNLLMCQVSSHSELKYSSSKTSEGFFGSDQTRCMGTPGEWERRGDPLLSFNTKGPPFSLLV